MGGYIWTILLVFLGWTVLTSRKRQCMGFPPWCFLHLQNPACEIIRTTRWKAWTIGLIQRVKGWERMGCWGNHCKAHQRHTSGWWFQPIWKYQSKWEYSPSRGENKTYLKPPPRIYQNQATRIMNMPHACLSNHITNRLIRNTGSCFSLRGITNSNDQRAEDTTKARLRKAIVFNDWLKLHAEHGSVIEAVGNYCRVKELFDEQYK